MPNTNPLAQASIETAAEFLAQSHLYKLGDLPTEAQNPATLELSDWAESNLSYGIQKVHDVDLRALLVLIDTFSATESLHRAIRDTLQAKKKIFLCGCGATGRLSLALETFWRRTFQGSETENAVVGFMAGGDIAIVRSVENFEDHPEFGERHLRELGFSDGDLLISTTEGGETPYVIGATEAAVKLSHRKPFFLYCNPDSILVKVADRSRRVIENPAIEKISFEIEPMALSGSTRLQASTVLMLAVGIHLLEPSATLEMLRISLTEFFYDLQKRDFDFLVPFIQEEARIYQAGDALYYRTGEFPVTVMTDTTERSPTFSLSAFENLQDPQAPLSWSYLGIPRTLTSEAAWRQVFAGRLPRGLQWPEYGSSLDLSRILGFDFSEGGETLRTARLAKADRQQHRFNIERRPKSIHFELGSLQHDLPVSTQLRGLDLLFEKITLKLILNQHSLFVMGKMGRYESNLMTYVRPSNGKLIDRSIRYIRALAKWRKIPIPSYEQTAEVLFRVRPMLRENDPIVIRVLDTLTGKSV